MTPIEQHHHAIKQLDFLRRLGLNQDSYQRQMTASRMKLYKARKLCIHNFSKYMFRTYWCVKCNQPSSNGILHGPKLY